MLATLHVALPFTLLMPEESEYRLYIYDDGEYEVTVDLPVKSDRPPSPDTPERLRIHGKPGFLADALTVKFRKPTFNRASQSDIDPPYEVLNRAIGSFLARLKYIARAPQVHTIELPKCPWRIQYLNDDGTPLSPEEGFVRGRGSVSFSFSFIACDPALWDHIHSLPPDFQPPPWHSLLVDSRGALPHVGTAVVLAATALEVLIADVLKQLFSKSTIPPSLWAWINDRGDWQKEPSVEEQYSVLLEVLCGHSLKEDNGLWEAFKNLRKARNSFVHEGVPKIAKSGVTAEEALALIAKADQIAEKVRQWLPEELRWPAFFHEVPVEFGKLLIRAPIDAPVTEPQTGSA